MRVRISFADLERSWPGSVVAMLHELRVALRFPVNPSLNIGLRLWGWGQEGYSHQSDKFSA